MDENSYWLGEKNIQFNPDEVKNWPERVSQIMLSLGPFSFFSQHCSMDSSQGTSGPLLSGERNARKAPAIATATKVMRIVFFLMVLV